MNNYGYQPPRYQQQSQYINFLKGRPVSSLEEVRATSIDFDGSVFYFPDLANQKIYTKQINMDGTSTLQMYQRVEIPSSESTTGDYITREEFERVIKQITTAQTPGEPAPQYNF